MNPNLKLKIIFYFLYLIKNLTEIKKMLKKTESKTQFYTNFIIIRKARLFNKKKNAYYVFESNVNCCFVDFEFIMII